jgi:hypothetical protein
MELSCREDLFDSFNLKAKLFTGVVSGEMIVL